jgi:hypothetical protein
MSAAGQYPAVLGQAAEMARARDAVAEERDAVLRWIESAETRSAIDVAPLAVIAEILTCLFAADERGP